MNALDCTDIKALLSALIDDRLDEHSRHFVERHLAECDHCRSQVDEHERLESLVAVSAQIALHERPDLPRGFINEVLARTVRAREPSSGVFRGAVTWTGWFAAAASIVLAVSIWLTDQQPSATAPQIAAIDPVEDIRTAPDAHGLNSWVSDDEPRPQQAPRAAYATGANLQSSVFHGTFASRDELLAISANRPTLGDPLRAPLYGEFAPDGERRLSDAPLSLTHRFTDSPFRLRSAPAISRDEADTIYNVSLLMHILSDVDVTSFEDVERVRRVVLADDLIDRLGETRERVDAADRPALLAAEAVLVRIVEGPLDSDDVRHLSETVARLDLPKEIGGITERWDRAYSM